MNPLENYGFPHLERIDKELTYQDDEKGFEFPHQGEKLYRRHPGESRGPVSFGLKSISCRKCLDSGIRRNDEIISNFQAFLPPENPFSSPCYITSSAKQTIKNFIKTLPFFHQANSFRRAIFKMTNPDAVHDERLGRYHLFCIFKNG
jgi:hypothetical protein